MSRSSSARRAATDEPAEADAPAPAEAGRGPSRVDVELPAFGETQLVPLVLRVLNGPFTGAESIVEAERVLIGNLESECDLILDVGMPERHACLLRLSHDGWTVLGIAGDLWVGRDFVPTQATRDIGAGDVLTLGRVAFAVGLQGQVDWSALVVAQELERPEDDAVMPRATLSRNPTDSRRRWNALRVMSGLGAGVILLAGAILYAQQAWRDRRTTPAEAEAEVRREQAALRALPAASEVRLDNDPSRPGHVLVEGFVPTRADMARVADLLRESGAQPDLRLVAVEELQRDLAQRFQAGADAAVAYAPQGQGHFVLPTDSQRIDQHDHLARTALQELPALRGLSLVVRDVTDPAGQPVHVDYERSRARPGDVEVQHLDEARQRLRYAVRELRLGAMPSIVLDDGARYFVGSRLPDGAWLEAIDERGLAIRAGAGQLRIELDGRTSVTTEASPPVADATGNRDKSAVKGRRGH